MDYPIDGVLDAVRTHAELRAGWHQILDLCRATAPKAEWDKLPVPDLERDIQAASSWVQLSLGSEPGPAGIYLGLDTLNMRRGKGTNVEIGVAAGEASSFATPEWVFDLPVRYGDGHLIRGLLELHQVYSKRRWRPVFDLCDYILFLGYSGLVFAQVFVRMREPRPLFPMWGFHDGDIFLLGHRSDGEFVRICRC